MIDFVELDLPCGKIIMHKQNIECVLENPKDPEWVTMRTKSHGNIEAKISYQEMRKLLLEQEDVECLQENHFTS